MSVDRHFVLRIERPGAKTRLFDLAVDQYSLGRAREVDGKRIDFPIEDDTAVSRMHCVFSRTPDGYAFENHSPNGSLVNDKLVDDRVDLVGGEKIKVGGAVTLTFHVYTAVERTRAFAALAATGDKTPTQRTTSFFQKPAFVGIVGFYLILGIVVMIMLQKEKPQSLDPGPGPEYFGWMITESLGTPGAVEGGDRRAAAAKMWQDTLAKHGGPMLEVGGNAYRVLLRARVILRSLGYSTVQEAIDAGETIATDFVQQKKNLEERLAKLYEKAKASLRSRRDDQAWIYLKQIRLAVPQSDQLIRRWAVQTMNELSPTGGR